MAGVQQEGGANYPKYWEVDNPVHQTFTPTIARYMDDLGTIVGGAVKAEII
jgi:hypothetical protein